MINVICITSFVALIGCLGSYHSRWADLLSIGLGFIAGKNLSDKVNKTIFEGKVSSKYHKLYV